MPPHAHQELTNIHQVQTNIQERKNTQEATPGEATPPPLEDETKSVDPETRMYITELNKNWSNIVLAVTTFESNRTVDLKKTAPN